VAVRNVVTGRVRDVLADVAVVVVSVLLSAGVALDSSMLRHYGGVTFAVLVAVALSLLARRWAPLTVAWIAVAVAAAPAIVELVAPGTLVRDATDVNPVLWWPPTAPFAAYSVLVHSGRRVVAWAAVLSMVAATALLAPAMSGPATSGAADTLGIAYRTAIFVAGFAVLGMYVHTRRRLLAGLVERAERAERERHLLAERARTEERTRLAAEMHDVITHRVSLMVVQAGALRVATSDESTRSAAEDIRAAGCLALEELRDVVGLLRDGSGPLPDAVESTTEPPVPDLTALIAESASVGIAVEVVEEGRPELAAAVVSRTAYRVVQEALTNVRKHAPGATVRLTVRYGPDGVRLTIRNSPRTKEADDMLAAAGSGVGLSGLRQRVDLVDGSLRAGPDGEGGFVVEATLPTSVPGNRPAGSPVASLGRQP